MLRPTPQVTPLTTTGMTTPTWNDVSARLEDAQFYWLATVRPDGRPHVMPVLGIWHDDALHFAAGPGSRKAHNLSASRSATVTVDSDDLHLVVEGETAIVRDADRLRRLAEEYLVKYGWQVTIRDGAYDGRGAPTAGPPPYLVYRLTPQTIFAFGSDESFTSTRWRL